MYKIFSLFFLSVFFLNACSTISNDEILLHETVLEEKNIVEDDKIQNERIKQKEPSNNSNEEKTNKKTRLNQSQNQNDSIRSKEISSEKNSSGETFSVVNADKGSQKTVEKNPPLKYTYEFIIEGLEPEGLEQADLLEIERVEILKQKLVDLLRENSQLEFLKDEPIENIVALERRAKTDTYSAVKVMESYGFYSSSAKFHIDTKTKPYKVFVYLNPQKQYTVNNIKITYPQKPEIPTGFSTRKKKVGFLYRKQVSDYLFKFPNEPLGIEKGDNAVATDISTAVGGLAKPFRDNGFPWAEITSSAYTINKKTYELNGNISINQGSPAFMGNVVVQGNKDVSSKYIEGLRTWKSGDIWDDRQLVAYRELLQKTGLFQTVDLQLDKKVYRKYIKKIRKNRKLKNPKPLDPVTLPVLLTVQESTARSIAGSLFYSTDQGPGANVYWEHRNFFGNGEKLTVKLPLSKDQTFLAGELRKPSFIFPTQTLVIKGSGGYENTDAYEQNFLDVGVGLEREIRHDWLVGSMLHIDRVTPKNQEGELEYVSVRWVNSVRYDKRDNKQNPTKGYTGLVKFSPLFGYDESSFYSLAMEFDGSIYYPLTEKVLLATRLGLGIMPGSGEGRIPRAKRFFLGGGGSVRGFSYQELGKHDSDDNPLGGLSYTLMNFEARIKVNKEMAIVPFIDGGMVYDEISPVWGQNLAWGAGIGVRYATPVGPVRVDIAVPLTNPNENTKKSFTDFQIYVSIGQAF